MRTLAIMHLGVGGGPPDHVRPWLAALATRGSLHIVVPEPGRVLDLYAPLGETIVLPYTALMFPARAWQLPLRGLSLARELLLFRKQLNRVRPDVLVVVTSVLPAAAAAGRLAKVPTIVYAAEILDGPSRRRRVAGRVLRRVVPRLASAIVCCSPAVARTYAGGAGSATVEVIIPGVDRARIAGDRRGFRRAHGLDGADPCLAVVGNISYGRGQDLVVRALPTLRREFPSARLVIAGQALPRSADLAYRRELIGLAEQSGVSDAITFTGFVERVGDVYAAADVVVNPVRVPEGLGHAALEAVAAGRPLVAARTGAVSELLRDGIDALLVEPDDPENLADAIGRLWRDPDLRTRLVETGRERVLREFGDGSDTEHFLQLVDEVLSRAAGQGPARLSAAPSDQSSSRP